MPPFPPHIRLISALYLFLFRPESELASQYSARPVFSANNIVGVNILIISWRFSNISGLQTQDIQQYFGTTNSRDLAIFRGYKLKRFSNNSGLQTQEIQHYFGATISRDLAIFRGYKLKRFSNISGLQTQEIQHYFGATNSRD